MDASRAQTIRKIAWGTLAHLYQRRFEIWSEPPASPFEIIEPSAAAWLENVRYKEEEEISDFVEDGSGDIRLQQLAGKFDPVAKTISVARNFGPEVLRFSAAHELGHLILHAVEGQEVRLFRDPPNFDSERFKKHRPEIEREADLFAAEFLMPTNLLRKTFREYFGWETLAGVTLDEEIAGWLSASVYPHQQITVRQLRTLSSRDLALLLARSFPWGGRRPFVSLCARFRVSDIAMAIQLEDLGLVFSRTGKGYPALGSPASKLSGLNAGATENKTERREGEGINSFDVFISYDNRDWSEVRKIVQELRNRGLRPWVDKVHLRPGKRWEAEVTRVIQHIPAMAVFVGSHGGEKLFRDLEPSHFLNRFKEQELPLIPVILPSVQGEPQFPPFLNSFSYIDFRLSDPDPLDQLVYGITGKNPHLDEE